MKKTITVFTPTYNRAYCLDRLYESLKRQTSNDFEWLIIDDGSSDNTRNLINNWIKENVVSIKYIFQENQGMHGAHNTAYKNIFTELSMCVDSDDYLTDDAIEAITRFWLKNKNNKYSGIIALNSKTDGNLLGNKLPENKSSSKLFELYFKYGTYGDKKLIYRTDVMKSYPEYPLYKEEKYVPLCTKYLLADQNFELLIMNKVVCNVEYQNDGSSLNIINQYKKNPRGFIYYRKIAMTLAPTLKRRFTECMHYVSSCLIINERRIVGNSTNKVLTFLAFPFGLFLYLFIIKTKKKTVISK